MRIPKSVTSLNLSTPQNYSHARFEKISCQNGIKYVKKLKIFGISYPNELFSIFSIIRPIDSFSCDEKNLYLIKQLKEYNFSINIKIKLRF